MHILRRKLKRLADFLPFLLSNRAAIKPLIIYIRSATICGWHMQRVPEMQNAEFHRFHRISCHQNLIIYMLVNKEQNHIKIIQLIEVFEEQDFLHGSKTGLLLKLLRKDTRTSKKSFIFPPSTKYITITILMTSFYGKKYVVKRGKREMTKGAKSVTSHWFTSLLAVTVEPGFCSVIARQFSTSLKKSQKFIVYVKCNNKWLVLVLKNNLLVSDL